MIVLVSYRCYDIVICGLGWAGIYEFDGLVSILYLCVSANPVFVILRFGIFVRVFTLPFGSILLEFVIFLFYSVFESIRLILYDIV